MSDLRSLSSRVQKISSCYLNGTSVIVVGSSEIFLNSLFEHLSNQGANVTIAHNIVDVDGDMAPHLVVFEVKYNMLLDLQQLIDQLHAKLDHPKILLIGDVETLPCADFIVSTGVAGILSNQATALQVCGALSLINSGMYVFPSTLLATIDPRPPSEPSGGDVRAMFSPREKDVLAGLCQGESNKQIARRLRMAEPTVRAHVRSILVKLGASNRTQASIWAIRHGFAAMPGDPPCRSDSPPGSSGAN